MRIVRELGVLALAVLAAVTLVFVLLRVVPGDPARLLLGEQASAVDVEALRHSLGLDVPLAEQYVTALRRAATGDLGTSYRSRKPVSVIVMRALPYTVLLGMLAMILSTSLAMLLGVTAGQAHGRWPDRGVRGIAALGISVPHIWLGPLLILIFAITLHWFPTSFDGSWRGWVLPSVTLASGLMAFMTRVVRAQYVEVAHDPFIRTARSKGLTMSVIQWRHIVRNVLIPVVTVAGLQAGAVLSGSVVTETMFGLPGLGQVLVEGILQRDYPVVEGCALWMALAYLLLSRAVDGLHWLIDPRMRTA